jgi:hypothetical protein
MSDLFDKNVGDLIRAGALPLDVDRTARARARFLRQDRPGWKLAAAAAAVLIAVTIVSSARTRTPVPPPATSLPLQAKPPVPVPMEGGNDLLKGSIRLQGKLRFEGRSTLPHGLMFRIRMIPMEADRVGDRLVSKPGDAPGAALVPLDKGVLEYDWPLQKPFLGKLDVTAPDAQQDISLEKLLKVPESQRAWTLRFRAWDERLLGLAGPQLTEITDLAREARDLTDRVQAACATEAEFKAVQKGLLKEAQRLQSRVETFVGAGLYPAASRQVAYAVSDLARSMEVFTWENGKLSGTSSYYTPDKKGRDHRGALFAFATLKTYLDEAVKIAGREFGLWIVEEFRRAGPRPELADALKPHRAHPGVEPFAARLASLDGADLATLDEDLRALGK